MHTTLDASHVVIDGQFVNAQVERVVLAINEYEPDIRVEWLPERARFDSNGEPLPAFKLVYAPPGQPEFIMFFVKSEDEFDMRVLQRIIVNDQRHGDKVTYDDIQAAEMAAKLIQKQEYQDWLEEQEDKVRHIIASPLHDYNVGDGLRIKHGIPFNANKLKD